MTSNIKRILRHTAITIGFGTFTGFLIALFSHPDNLFSGDILFHYILYSILLTFFFWKGNMFIIRILNKRYSWIKETQKMLTLHLSLVFFYNTLVILTFYLYLWFIVNHKQDMHNFVQSIKGGFYMCMSITAIATLFSYSYNFFKNWKISVIKEEELKREQIVLKYEALKNQVNPHFLFNSLNVLTALIEMDKDASIKYVKQLSEVMRYVLEQNSTELVSIGTELKFIDSFVYLLKIRFNENLNLSIKIADAAFFIVPVALQILIENAVKHNEISSDKPLQIEITEDDDYVLVQNNIQKRNYLPDSNYIGLKSLAFQYEILSDKRLEIDNNGSHFTVKIPKIKQLA